jgi:hypothetical protein
MKLIWIFGAALFLQMRPGFAVAQRPQAAEHVWSKPELRLQPKVWFGPTFLGSGDHDYRYTGFYIGLGLGAAATLWSVAWCSDSDNGCSVSRAVLLGPVVTAALGITGAVIGGLFPKRPREGPEAPSE